MGGLPTAGAAGLLRVRVAGRDPDYPRPACALPATGPRWPSSVASRGGRAPARRASDACRGRRSCGRGAVSGRAASRACRRAGAGRRGGNERLYVLCLGSLQGNRHVHWHLVPLPPGVPYEQQQVTALAPERGTSTSRTSAGQPSDPAAHPHDLGSRGRQLKPAARIPASTTVSLSQRPPCRWSCVSSGSRRGSVAFSVTGQASGLEEAQVTWPVRAR